MMTTDGFKRALLLAFITFIIGVPFITACRGRALFINTGPEEAGDKMDVRTLQEGFLKLGFGLFLHFNMATFIDRPWATGYEDAKLFAPKKLDCNQWAETARAAGMKYAVLTVKHTGGWCLWDSAHTEHDITQFVNYKNGKGDIVREFVDAFRKRGIKVGFYYCFPGNFSGTEYSAKVPPGKPDLHGLPPEADGDYVGFIKKQLKELLSNYGAMDLMWIDQIGNKYTERHWLAIKAYIKSLQPRCLVIGNNAHDLKNSDIYGCEFPFDPKGMPPEGNRMPAEVCDKLTPHWFWTSTDDQEDMKSVRKVVDMLKLCNERKANYLLNVPPNKNGLIDDACVKRLREIGAKLRMNPRGGSQK
ncbi:MAG: alpha-L-fucosidase [Planctomycetota bacterium]|jgi:alpha-L-fucosidase